AGPLCIAYGTQVPLNAFNLWLEKISVVPCTFQRHRNGHRFNRHEFFEVNRERFFYLSLHVQLPCITIDYRYRKMRSNIERFGRCNKAVNSRKRHLQIQRAFAAHNSTVAKFCLLLWHLFERLLGYLEESESFLYKLI